MAVVSPFLRPPAELQQDICAEALESFLPFHNDYKSLEDFRKQFVNLRLVSRQLRRNLTTAQFREMFGKAEILRFNITPSLQSIQRLIPRASEFIRTETFGFFPGDTANRQCLVMEFAAHGEIFVEVGPFDRPMPTPGSPRVLLQVRVTFMRRVRQIVLHGITPFRQHNCTKLTIRFHTRYHEGLPAGRPDVSVWPFFDPDTEYTTQTLEHRANQGWREVAREEMSHLHAGPRWSRQRGRLWNITILISRCLRGKVSRRKGDEPETGFIMADNGKEIGTGHPRAQGQGDPTRGDELSKLPGQWPCSCELKPRQMMLWYLERDTYWTCLRGKFLKQTPEFVEHDGGQYGRVQSDLRAGRVVLAVLKGIVWCLRLALGG